MTRILHKPKLQITAVKPVYGVNYNKGYIGFTYDKGNFIAEGIVHFTHWASMSIKLSHLVTEATRLQNAA